MSHKFAVDIFNFPRRRVFFFFIIIGQVFFCRNRAQSELIGEEKEYGGP